MHVTRLAPMLEGLPHALLIISLIASVPTQAPRELVDLSASALCPRRVVSRISPGRWSRR